MNGHTFLRSYRVIMLLGMTSFLATAYIYSVPEDHNVEEYPFVYAGEPLWPTSRADWMPPPSTPSRTGPPPISQKSTATTCTK